MANEEHLEILKQGVEVWNEWRHENRFKLLIPDLCHADLRGQNLCGVNFSYTDFKEADLGGADLSGADFSNTSTSLRRANLVRANLSGVNFNGMNLAKANFLEVNLSSANLDQVELREANLSGANLCQTSLSSAKLLLADLSSANLEKAILWHVSLQGASLQEANLNGADLRFANLNGADFRKANLNKAILLGTQALATDFSNAIFTGACLEDWHINTSTKLDEVICEYVYQKFDPYPNHSERRPHSRDFKTGEFTKLYQKALETIDIVFLDGIDWKAFLLSFWELKSQTGSDEISIQSFENRNDAFIVRINVSPDVDKAEIERFVEEKYKMALEAKDNHIASLEDQLSVRYQENTQLRSELFKIAVKMSEVNKIENNFYTDTTEFQQEDYQYVIEQDKKRFSVLRAIYRNIDGNIETSINAFKICKITGIRGEEFIHILEYLEKEELIKALSSLYGGIPLIRITHKGMCEVEAAIKKPNKSTEHFHYQVFQSIFNAPVGNVQQAGEGNSSNIHQNIRSNKSFPNNQTSQE